MNRNCKKSVASIFILAMTVVFADKANAQTITKDTSVIEIKYPSAKYEPGSIMQIPRSRSIASYSASTGDVLGKTTVPNLTNTLYGRLNGLIVTQNTGEPGYDQASLFMRGRATYDNANIICYVDGFQVDINNYMQYLSPAEIETVALLKDPVTLATFGIKGANGILWITTKRAKSSEPGIDVQVVSGVQQAININKPYDSYNYARLYNQAVSNDNYAINGYQYLWNPAYTNDQLKAYQNGAGTNVDWYKEVLKKNANYTDANVNVKGGIGDDSKYNLFLDYMDQTGLYNAEKGNNLGTDENLRRLSVRANMDLKFFKIFEAKIDLGGRTEDRRVPYLNGTNTAAFWKVLAIYPDNIYPVKDSSTGNWSGNSSYPDNPVAQLNATGFTTYHVRTALANFNLKEDLGFITPGLYLKEAVSFNTWTQGKQDKTATYARYIGGSTTTNDKTIINLPGSNQPWGQTNWRQSTITAGYDRTSGDHALSAAFNYYASEQLPDANTDITKLYYNFENIGGRINYAYKSRYIADLGLGYSGSDNYAPGNQWKLYPAASLGWIVSNEAFLKDNKFVDFFKLRASIGLSGNDQTNNGRYLYQQYFNNSLPARIATPGIYAEKSLKKEVGFDLSLLRKLIINADWFYDRRSGIITQNNLLPGYLGYTGAGVLPLQNIGKVNNRGVELSVGYADKAGAFNYAITVMGTYAKNKIDYQAEIPNKNSFTNTTGLPIGTPMGLVADGLYQLGDFNSDGTLKAGMPVPGGPVQPGDIKYRDLDHNGLVDNNDITKIGNPTYPNFYYSFNLNLSYEGFDLSALFQGASGLSINLLGASYNQIVPFVDNNSTRATAIYPAAGKAWAYYPDQGIDTRNTATFPRLTTQPSPNNYSINSTFWMKNASFLRLRTVQLGYTMSERLTRTMRLKKLRIFISAINPSLWSSFYKTYNIDPETQAGYPALKSFTAGLSLTL